MTRPPPLPRPVPFPVYGLASDYSGPRHRVQWDGPDDVRRVVLAHGDLSADDVLEVQTQRKAPRPQRGAEPISSEPQNVGSAAMHTIIRAADLFPWWTRAGSARRKALINTESGLIEFGDGGVTLRDWADVAVDVGGAEVPAHLRAIDRIRAVVIDLPEVVIAITAYGGFDVTELHLVDVRDSLDDYPPPSIRERMQPPRDPPAVPERTRLLPVHLGLRDILANAQDEETDPRELLARIEHVADHLLHVNLPESEEEPPPV